MFLISQDCCAVGGITYVALSMSAVLTKLDSHLIILSNNVCERVMYIVTYTIRIHVYLCLVNEVYR